MNSFFEHEGRTALFEGMVAAALLLMLNAIAHFVFDAPEIPFVYGWAGGIAVMVAVIRSIAHSHDGTHHGA
jgi:hypothetical protein